MTDARNNGARYVVRVRPPFDAALLAGGPSADPAEFLRAHYGACAGWSLGAERQGLSLALDAAGVGAGDAVVMADFNCSSLLGPVRRSGAGFLFVDLRGDWTYDPGQLAAACREPTAKALVLTHYFGQSCVTDDLRQLVAETRARGMLVIEDCAHSACDEAQPEIGTLGDVALFSAGNDKCAGGGKGGFCLVRNPVLAEKMAPAVAALAEREAWRERLYAIWYLVYALVTEPTACRPGIVSVLPRTDARPGEAEFAETLAAVAANPRVETLREFPAARGLLENCGIPGATESADPERMGPVSGGLIGRFFASGLVARGVAVRAANRAAIDRLAGAPAGGRGSRLRYSVAYPDAARAAAARAAARGRGVEAACFNWEPLLSECLGERRAQPAWAVTPARVVNFPVHSHLEDGDLAAIAASVAAGGLHSERKERTE